MPYGWLKTTEKEDFIHPRQECLVVLEQRSRAKLFSEQWEVLTKEEWISKVLTGPSINVQLESALKYRSMPIMLLQN